MLVELTDRRECGGDFADVRALRLEVDDLPFARGFVLFRPLGLLQEGPDVGVNGFLVGQLVAAPRPQPEAAAMPPQRLQAILGRELLEHQHAR